MNIDLPTQYDPKSVESAIYKKWLDAKVFHAVPDGRPNKFSIVIPPPNVTGALHLGHAINGTIQDILIRYHRMKGDNTLWMPGIDHAGIATQAVVEKTIFEKEKKSRHDLATPTHTSREELVRRIWQWKEQFGTRIINQQEQLGISCDWDRTRFTLDDICAKAVREAFFKMFKGGLIFRGKRLVNWDTHLQTAVADDEIYHETVQGQMTSIRYPIETPGENPGLAPANKTPGGSPGLAPASESPPTSGNATEYLIVATTRPETMLGDTAVAVHPDDPRYKHLIGKHVILPLIGRRIPIIPDGQLVDPKFGTGVVKVTPAHDPNDYATGERHSLEKINLLTPDGKVNENGQGEFRGIKYSYTGLKFATAARKKILEDLEDLDLIADKKTHEHEVGHSDRSKTPIEPYLSDQWFVRMGDITTPPSEPRPSGSGISAPSEPRLSGSGVSVPAHSNALAYFITFHTYATWVRGKEPGSVDDEHNIPGTPFVPPDPKLMERELSNAAEPPLSFTLPQRQSVCRTIQEVASFRGWTIHALNVRSTHVHLVVSGNHAPERMMNDFKSYATRRMVEASLLPKGANVWSRHGSTRYLWKDEHVSGAVQYTLHDQGENVPDTFSGHRPSEPQSEPRPSGSGISAPSEPRPSGSGISAPSEPRPSGSGVAAVTQPLPHGRGSEVHSPGITLANGQRAPGLAQAAMDAVLDGRVKITPDRYAKGYLDWLGQKRDWCISRQLWWGHRITVWWKVGFSEDEPINEILDEIAYQEGEGRAFRSSRSPKDVYLGGYVDPQREVQFESVAVLDPEGQDADFIEFLEEHGYHRDPDVLDTWFSSALWPISTMGWPTEGTSAAPEDQLLPYFYPTSVLSTARDILTLWVARMVMFGLYCRGDVPFKNVFVHPVIQDGEGKIMSKSKGNGVDPVEIINSHGADALRFTLASLATETQDIRMPVVKDPKTGANTSPKFDIGRNFANKIWNASRFILSNIDEEALRHKSTKAQREADVPAPGTLSASVPLCLSASHLEDRWILSRLHTTIRATEAAINNFHFADLAESLRTFFWTDLCDWYLEISKARIKSGDATVQAILLECLTTSLKLLHPMMPFITEELWSKLPSAPGSAGEPSARTLLATTPWPKFDPARLDPAAESQIALIQQITSAIREIQNRYPAAKGKDVVIKPRTADLQSIIEASRAIIEPLALGAGAKITENSPTAQKPDNAATTLLTDGGGAEIYIGGVIDKSAESAKLKKRRAELLPLIAGNTAKLANESFTAKAPPKIVQGLRDQLAKLEEELSAIEKNLAELERIG